ncbi:hypothetical protein [Komagataeibacter xylinus]|uniref:hypothetical protein n=1 Tax=Komagataeibacter xylinus TaxID=28448 RepID=UPI00280B6FD6|nr:hypothetical protein [Komagataeibacter xylinus]
MIFARSASAAFTSAEQDRSDKEPNVENGLDIAFHFLMGRCPQASDSGVWAQAIMRFLHRNTLNARMLHFIIDYHDAHLTMQIWILRLST